MRTPEDVINEIKESLNTGKKIPAIKLIRHATGLGLKESKEIADNDAKDLTPEMIRNLLPLPEDLKSAATTQGCFGKAAMLMLAVCGLIYYLIK